jgi:hypothetical protein
VYAAPAKPVITGPSTVCVNQQGVPYSVSPVYGATSYVWGAVTGSTIASGQGTTGVTVNFGSTAGNVTCQAWNACGKRGTTTKAVAFNCRQANMLNNVVIQSGNSGTGVVQLQDLQGRILQHHEITVDEGENVFGLDVHEYTKGIYLVTVEQNGTISRMKFVIE